MFSLFKFLQRKNVRVLKIFCKNKYYHVKPSHGSYDMIYRAARGVYWDKETSTLYFKGITTREEALRIISEAMKNEYDITLKF